MKTSKWTPPRGVRLIDQPTCLERTFAVQWIVEGRRKTKGFTTAEAQVSFAKGLAGDIKAHGSSTSRLDELEISEWRAFRQAVGHDVALTEVAEVWRRYGARERITVSEAIDRLMAARRLEGVARTTLCHYDAIHGRFKAAFGDCDVAAVTGDDVTGWLEGVSDEMAPVTVRTHFIRVRSLFSWLMVKRLIAQSPLDGMKAPRLIEEEVSVLPITEAKRLFSSVNCAVSRELMGRLAVEAFAGARHSSVAHLIAEEIQFETRGIVLRASVIKQRRRQFIDGLPENLWAWLEWSNPATWTMDASQYMHAKSIAFARACVVNPGNVLRHSFCSYHVASLRDVSRTAVILCHSNPKMLWAAYKGRATEADGKAWFEIMPPPA